MAYQKQLIKLETKNIVLVKSSNSTPSGILSLSTLDIDNIPVVDHDSPLCQTVHVYRSTIHDSDSDFPDDDPAYVIKEALSKALFYYYPLAGRLMKHADGKLRVNCSADQYGVPFLEASANCHLSSLHYLDGTDTEITKKFVLDLPSHQQDKSFYQYPLVFMVTKFLCGGFTIGMGVSHAVCDGFGASQFFRTIIEFARGRSEPSVKPVWERERLVGSITKQQQQQPLHSLVNKTSATVSPFLPTTVIKQICFKVNGDMIKRLKLSLMKESDDESESESMKEKFTFTSFESLAAYVWRSRVRALKLNYDGKTMLTFVVGVRRNLLDHPLPEGYYGNAIVDANIVLTVRDLNERPLAEIAKVIKETKKVAFTTDYIRNSINSLETRQNDCNFGDSGATTVLTEWKHLGLMEDLDFGGKEAVNLVPTPYEPVAMCIFTSPSRVDDLSMKGGARIFTSLPIAAIPKFREEMEALRLLC